MEQLSLWIVVWIVAFGAGLFGTKAFLVLREFIRQRRADSLQYQRQVLNAKDQRDPMEAFIESVVLDAVACATLVDTHEVQVAWKDAGQTLGMAIVYFHNGRSERVTQKVFRREVFESVDQRMAWLDELVEQIELDRQIAEEKEAG